MHRAAVDARNAAYVVDVCAVRHAEAVCEVDCALVFAGYAAYRGRDAVGGYGAVCGDEGVFSAVAARGYAFDCACVRPRDAARRAAVRYDGVGGRARFNRSRVRPRDAARVCGFDAVAEGRDAGYRRSFVHLSGDCACGYIAVEVRSVDAEVADCAAVRRAFVSLRSQLAEEPRVVLRAVVARAQADDAEAASVERPGEAVSACADSFKAGQRRRVDVVLEREVVAQECVLLIFCSLGVFLGKEILYALELLRVADPNVDEVACVGIRIAVDAYVQAVEVAFERMAVVIVFAEIEVSSARSVPVDPHIDHHLELAAARDGYLLAVAAVLCCLEVVEEMLVQMLVQVGLREVDYNLALAVQG